MKAEFNDVRIIAKPDPNKVKAGSKPYTHTFFFPLSCAPPQRWNELLVQEWLYRIMQNPRHIWIKKSELVIDCPVEELMSIVERVGADIQIVNRKYRNEIERKHGKTDREIEQAAEEKRADEDSIKKTIDALRLPD